MEDYMRTLLAQAVACHILSPPEVHVLYRMCCNTKLQTDAQACKSYLGGRPPPLLAATLLAWRLSWRSSGSLWLVTGQMPS